MTATTSPTARPQDPRGPEGGRRTVAWGRPTGGSELGWWLFMRISGLLLLVLVVGHVLIMHVLDTGVERVDFEFVALRWDRPFWRTWDWLMLSLALLHGANGLRVVILDYVRRPGSRFVLTWFFNIVALVMFFLGTVVVFTFDPASWPTTT
jgi:succinate dehydrogenase / fumarate reductase membrane anchor subunit